MTSFMEMKLKSFRKVKSQIMAAVGTLEILVLLGYGADALKKGFYSHIRDTTMAKNEIIYLPRKCGGISSNGFHIK